MVSCFKALIHSIITNYAFLVLESSVKCQISRVFICTLEWIPGTLLLCGVMWKTFDICEKKKYTSYWLTSMLQIYATIGHMSWWRWSLPSGW